MVVFCAVGRLRLGLGVTRWSRLVGFTRVIPVLYVLPLSLLVCAAQEPTTGLDAFNALAMMGTLRRLASSGRSVVATIHQPRSAIYAMVDTLLLLAGGRVAYYGPAAGAVVHFARLGFRCPPRFNPADFFIDLTAVPSAPTAAAATAAARIRHLARHAHSSRAAGAASAVGVAPAEGGVAAGGGGVVRRPAGRRDLHGAGAHHLSSSSSHSSSRGGTPGMAGEVDKAAPVVAGDAPPIAGRRRPAWPREFRILLGRAARLMVRERRANAIRAFQTIVFATVLSLIWLNQGRDAGVAGVSGILFVLLINRTFGVGAGRGARVGEEEGLAHGATLPCPCGTCVWGDMRYTGATHCGMPSSLPWPLT